jgi:hypothetical protein
VNTKKQLRQIERDLNGIIAAITQVSGRRARRARRVAQIATGKITGVATIGGMLMFISAFGSASTGTAIGALSGAAATSAQMYWIGSIFGMGAVAGAIILPGIGAILGLVAALFLSRAVFGRPRKPEKMQEFEVRALFASLRLAEPVASHLAYEAPAPSRDELRVYAHEGLLPLCNLIDDHLAAPVNANETDNQCQSFENTLALLPQWKLRRHHRRLFRRATKLARPKRETGIRGLLRSSSRSLSNA